MSTTKIVSEKVAKLRKVIIIVKNQVGQNLEPLLDEVSNLELKDGQP